MAEKREEKIGEENSGDSSAWKPDIPWLVNASLVTLVSVFLRFYWLELKPLHHDEGVNGYFLTRLFREGIYQYDPTNYHGPDLYYISLLFTKVFGLNTLSVRWSVAVFGVLTVVLTLFLKRWIGKIGALSAALMLALSPGMVYISRYFIHEMLFVFFSLSFVAAILYFIEREKAGVFAIGWMALLMMVCFLPPALRLPGFIVEDRMWQWGIGIGIFALEAGLVFLVIRMLLVWDNGRPVYLLLASASLILLFATKETAFITVGTMLIAWVCVRAWQKIASSESFASRRGMILWIIQIGLPALVAFLAVLSFERLSNAYAVLRDFFVNNTIDQVYPFYGVIFLVLTSFLAFLVYIAGEKFESFGTGREDARHFSEPSFKTFSTGVGKGIDRVLVAAACGFVFVYVGALFFSSFFTYPQGVLGAFQAYAVWAGTGSTDHTQNGTFAYLRWMMELESPVLVLGLLGSLLAWVRAKDGFALFTGLWGFGLFAAYTIIPYKTPWLALSFILPMCIAAGYGIGHLAGSRDLVRMIFAGLLAAVGCGLLAFQTFDLNFVRYDDDRMPYVYAHTRRGFEDLMARVKRIAATTAKKNETAIDIVSPDYWPMPWYLNDYPNAVYHAKLTDSSKAEMIIANKNQEFDLGKYYGTTHRIIGTYPLRPGVDLVLMLRNDLKVRE